MVKRQQLISNELNKTHDTPGFVEDFHASECFGIMGQAGLIEEERLSLLLDQGKVEERRSRLLEALLKMNFAKIAGREGNFRYATELYDEVLEKINVLNSPAQQESALAFFYYDYSQFLRRIGLENSSVLHLEHARAIVRSNKLKQVIGFQLLVSQKGPLKKSVLRKWYQSIAYFNRYDMTVMEAQAHYELARRFLVENAVHEATEHLDIAHEIAATSGYNFLRWAIDLTRGVMLRMQEREPELILYYEDLLKKVGNNFFKSRLLYELASMYQKSGDLEKALEYAKEGTELSQRFAIESELASLSALLARLYHRQEKDMTRAFFYFQQAHETVMDLARNNIPIVGDRLRVVRQYVRFLEEHFPGDVNEAANEDLFAFSREMEWVRIKDLFHYNLFLYHYTNTGVGNKTLKALEIPASSFYSTTERLRRRGIPFPNFRKTDVDIPADHYMEGLQQYCRMHRDLNWVQINELFEKDMLAYHYKLNNYNKKQLAKNLGLAYSGIVNRTRYLTANK
ncbi:MAG: hypothetical protein K9N38_07650 [Candidatus Marinimicrobia bacterium]|nr:hypothetical protein [Candidatus Neomarinimicrobiota bacterium]MCF7851046.1 hypothetical protein [Candidatus Neomarinimicrobiota bacterium]